MLERIMGIITFKTPTYRAIVNDAAATTQAAVLVMAVALIQGLCGILIPVLANNTSLTLGREIRSVALMIILGLLVWVIIAGLLTTFAKAFGGKTGMLEMLRVSGFVQAFGLLSIFGFVILIIPAFTFTNTIIAAAIFGLNIIGYYIGVRETSGLSRDKAIITAVLATIVALLFIFFLDGISNAVLPNIL